MSIPVIFFMVLFLGFFCYVGIGLLNQTSSSRRLQNKKRELENKRSEALTTAEILEIEKDIEIIENEMKKEK